MNKKHRWFDFRLMILVIVALSGCTGSFGQPVITPTAVLPTAMPPTATATSTPIPTPFPTATPTPEVLKITYDVTYAGPDGDYELTGRLFFYNNRAVTMLPDSDMVENVFHLERMEWENAETMNIMQFSRCERLVQIEASRTRNAISSEADSPAKEFVTALLNPEFEVEQEGSTVTLLNDFLNYRVETTSGLPADQLEQFYAYSRMNACNKAITGASISPYSEYAFLEELQSRDLFPEMVELQIKFEETTIVSTSSYTVGYATTGEEMLVKGAIHY